MNKNLGKIERVSIGMGGYQNAMIGISFVLTGVGWGVCDFWGDWGTERTDSCEWTEQDRITRLGLVFMRILSLLGDAKVDTVDELKDIPVEATFNDSTLTSWRILKEVL